MIRQGEKKLDDGIGYNEWRVCHCGCGARFRPVVPTEYHATAECAARCLKRRDYEIKTLAPSEVQS